MDDSELSYEELKPFACKECPNAFRTKHSLKLHTSSVHSKGTFECSKCDFKCERMGKMTFHMQRHLQKERHPKRSDEYGVKAKIPSITIKLGNNKLFINHNNVTESHKIQKTLPNDEPNREFREQKQLKVYKNVNRSNGSFSCEICKKWFSRRVHFLKHMIIKHADIKSIPKGLPKDGKHLRCLICHKRFSGKGILKRHMLKHTGAIEKPFECTKCEIKFDQKLKLHQHMMKYHENRPFRCNKCNESFTQCIELQNHMAIHTQTKTYKCKKCDKSFSMRRDLKRHMLLCHNKKDDLQRKKPANKLILKRSVSKSTKKNHTTININITVNSEPKITVNSEPNITVNSEPKITVNSEPNITLNSEPKITVNSEPNITVNSEPNITVNSEPPASTEKSMKCMKCHEYVKFSSLREHMDMHQNAFRCEDCNRIFTSQHSLRIHKSKVHRENLTNTDEETESESLNPSNKDVLTHSLRRQSMEKTKDHQEIIDSKNLNLNLQDKNNCYRENAPNISPIIDDTKIQCEICHRVFDTTRNRNIHRTRAHKENTNDKDKTLHEENKNSENEEKTNGTLSIKNYKDLFEVKCEICDKIFYSLRSVNIHKGRAHKEYSKNKDIDSEDDHKSALSEDAGYDSYIDQDHHDFKCEICDKYFHSKGSVNIHKSKAHKEFYPNVILRRLPEMKIERPKMKPEITKTEKGMENHNKENADLNFSHLVDDSDFEDSNIENNESAENEMEIENYKKSKIITWESYQKENLESNYNHPINDLDFEDSNLKNKESTETEKGRENYQKINSESNINHEINGSDIEETNLENKESTETEMETENVQNLNVESNSNNITDVLNLKNSNLEDLVTTETEMETEISQKENLDNHELDDTDSEDSDVENDENTEIGMEKDDYGNENFAEDLSQQLYISDSSDSEFENNDTTQIEQEKEYYKKENLKSNISHQLEDDSDLEDSNIENKEWEIKSYEVGSKLRIKLLTSPTGR